MRIIKLKDLLREHKIIEADLPPVKSIEPPAQHAYGQAAGDAAGKPYTQPNIDFKGVANTSGVKSTKLATALNIARGSGDIIQKAMEIIRPEENNKEMKFVFVNKQKYKNYEKSTNTWHPYPDKSGWSIGYGHWSQNKPSGPITDKQAEENLKVDIQSKINLAKRLIKINFEKFPDAVKLGIINSLYRGEKSPNAFRELNKPEPDFLEAAKAYIDTKDKSAIERMKMNAGLIASGHTSDQQ
jgi:hypothetical protein